MLELLMLNGLTVKLVGFLKVETPRPVLHTWPLNVPVDM